VAKKTRLKHRSKYTWRDAPDSVLLAHLPTNHRLDRAESLCPTVSTVERAADGEAVAAAIISHWQADFSSYIVRAVQA
jgi:hypothetical protein